MFYDKSKPVREKCCWVTAFPGVQARCLPCHSAKGRLKRCQGSTILPLEMRHPNSTGSFFFFFFFYSPFLLRIVLPDKEYRRKAQLPSAVPFCGFSHTKLCPGCRFALCYYDRKKWISNVLPLPAARSLWILSPGTRGQWVWTGVAGQCT